MSKSTAFRPSLLLIATFLLASCTPGFAPEARATKAGPARTASPLLLDPTNTASAAASPDGTPTAGPTPTRRPGPTPPPGEDAGDRWESPVDGMTQFFVPAGDFMMGASADFEPAEPDERPQREITLPSFWIDSTEVTIAMYELCLEDGACSPPVGPIPEELDGSHPAAGVSWQQAQTYCRWAGRDLPSDAQWEKAARGSDGRRYPWGWIGGPESGGEIRLNFCDTNCPFDYRDEAFDDDHARSAPVGSFPAGASPYGALDMAGNVWEWTANWYRADAYKPTPTAQATARPEPSVRSVRGASWAETTWEGLALVSRASNRFWHQPAGSRPDLGFRCAYTP